MFPRRTAENTLSFLKRVIEEMPFPVQCVQTDRGTEFFANKVQKRLVDWGIKSRPLKPCSPHLNGQVERTQKTDLDEFYSTVGLNAPELEEQLDLWQHFYNCHRPHGGLDGKSPMEKYLELIYQTPLSEEVDAMYDLSKERLRVSDYQLDLELGRLKLSA